MISSALATRPSDTVRCDRQVRHPTHEYVATPTSPVILTCPGLRTTRSLSQLLAERPELKDFAAPGVVRYVLGVAAA